MIDPNILNLEKSDYENTPLFLGEAPGLHDSINDNYPQLKTLFKRLKKMDWDEVEFNFSPCKVEFKNLGVAADMMIETIAFQWESDTVAARQLLPVVAPFVSNSGIWRLYSRIADNEVLHADTYSEIIKMSFDNPSEVIKQITGIQATQKRLDRVAAVFSETRKVGIKLLTGEISRHSDEAYDAIFLFVFTLLCLERIQFMSSFTVTFGLANSGMFIPIGLAVQKICADEYEIHAAAGKAILDIELRTERGLMAFNRHRTLLQNILTEILLAEEENARFLFRDGRELPGITAETVIGEAWRCGNDIAKFMGFQLESPYLSAPPLAYMEKWMKLDNMQGSPMEQRDGKYLLGGVISNDDDATFDIEGL